MSQNNDKPAEQQVKIDFEEVLDSLQVLGNAVSYNTKLFFSKNQLAKTKGRLQTIVEDLKNLQQSCTQVEDVISKMREAASDHRS